MSRKYSSRRALLGFTVDVLPTFWGLPQLLWSHSPALRWFIGFLLMFSLLIHTLTHCKDGSYWIEDVEKKLALLQALPNSQHLFTLLMPNCLCILIDFGCFEQHLRMLQSFFPYRTSMTSCLLRGKNRVVLYWQW